jgi:hypothetical protein
VLFFFHFPSLTCVKVLPSFQSDSDSLNKNLSQQLQVILSTTITKDVVQEVIHDAQSRKGDEDVAVEPETALEKVIQRLQPALRFAYQNAWEHVLRVLKEALKAVVNGLPLPAAERSMSFILAQKIF